MVVTTKKSLAGVLARCLRVLWGRRDRPDKDTKSDHGFTTTAGAFAFPGRVVRGLSRKGGEPEDGPDEIDGGEGVGIGVFAGEGVADGHGEVDDGGDGEEALFGGWVSDC